MADENINQQPEQTEPADQMQRVKEQMSKLKELGIDINLLFDMMGGVAENVVKKSEQNLSGLIETKVKVLGEGLSKQVADNYNTLNDQLKPVIGFIDSIQKQASQPGTELVPAGGDLPVGPELGASSGPMGGIGQIMPILKMLGLVPGGGEQSNNGLSAMTAMAKSWGEVMRAMMEPVVEMQTTMRQSLLQEMQTYSKTGGNLPWDGETEQPRSRVALNQPRPVVEIDYKKLADEMAKNMKLG